MSKNIKKLLDEYIQIFTENNEYNFNKWKIDTKYEEAVKLAYNDAKRAFVRINQTKKTRGIRNLSVKVKEYFNDDKAKFNHKDLCKSFLNEFNSDMEYGGSQKVVNLTFKYLYCYDKKFDSENFNKDKFNECHMILDSFILKWIRKNKKLKEATKIDAKTTRSRMDKNTYLKVQKAIKEFIKNKSIALTPFEYEFILWPNLILYKEATSFITRINKFTRVLPSDKLLISNLDKLISEIPSFLFIKD